MNYLLSSVRVESRLSSRSRETDEHLLTRFITGNNGSLWSATPWPRWISLSQKISHCTAMRFKACNLTLTQEMMQKMSPSWKGIKVNIK